MCKRQASGGGSFISCSIIQKNASELHILKTYMASINQQDLAGIAKILLKYAPKNIVNPKNIGIVTNSKAVIGATISTLDTESSEPPLYTLIGLQDVNIRSLIAPTLDWCLRTIANNGVNNCGQFLDQSKPSNVTIDSPPNFDDGRMQLRLFISSIGNESRYSFNSTVDGDRAHNDFNSQLLGIEWKGTQAIYNAYVVQYVAPYKTNDIILYKQYLSNPTNINGIVNDLMSQYPGTWLGVVNFLFCKLYCLTDVNTTNSVINIWKGAVPNQAFSYLPPSNGVLCNPSTFPSNYWISYAGNAAQHDVDGWYGNVLWHWIMSVSNWGYNTGNSPQGNQVPSGGSCFISESKVIIIKDNKKYKMSIELIKANTYILNKNFKQSTTSNEAVISTKILNNNTQIYGINNIKPFFTAGHLFFLKNGNLGAINPLCAIDDNQIYYDKNHKIKKLHYGDEVLYLNINNNTKKWIKIKKITQ
eukprot:144631_1